MENFNYKPIYKGSTKPEIIIVCEPSRDYKGLPMQEQSYNLILNLLTKNNVSLDNLLMIQFCPPIPEEISVSKSRTNKWLVPYVEKVNEIISKTDPKIILTLGDYPTRHISGSNLKFSSVRGTLIDTPVGKVFPITSPSQAIVRPENRPILEADILNLSRIIEGGYKALEVKDKNYYWAEDISDILEKNPELIAIDTETTGLDWKKPTTRILTIQITCEAGVSAVCPVCPIFWDWTGREDKRLKLIEQIKELLDNPKVKKVGQNITYDLLMLYKEGYMVRGVYADTELWAWGVDENLLQKNIDNLCKIYLPEMSGYNDYYNEVIDKSNMCAVDKELFLPYAGGDTDATFRLFHVLDERLKKEPTQRNLLTKVKMPFLALLFRMTLRGVKVDLDYLDELRPFLQAELDKKYSELIDLVPSAVVKKHYDAGLKFTRDRFVADIMFSKEGFGLKPRVFTKTTASLPDEQKIPSVSAKQHFPYFIGIGGDAGKFVDIFIEYTKLEKLLSTYVNSFKEKYVSDESTIHSNFSLARTVTGRTASSNPNSQNWPARGPYAKKYKKIVVARKGYSFVSADLSQIELRLVAHVANEKNMIELYRQDKDIHAFTARISMGLSQEQWDRLSKEEKSLNRFRAKAVNFGYVYGMSAKKFVVYAKTDYGIDYTKDESEELRDNYFKGFPALKAWHKNCAMNLRRNGYAMSIDGHIRHLPSVFSEDEGIAAAATRQAVNAPIQGTASNLGLMAMYRIAKQGNPNIKPVLFIHDDCILEVKEGYEWEAANALCWVMRNHNMKRLFGVDLKIPIKGEPDVGKSLGEMYELGDLPSTAPEWVKSIPKIDPLNPVKPSWWNNRLDV